MMKKGSDSRKQPFAIGVMGGIGSGKSYVCRLLAQRGIPVYSSDDEAKRLMTTDPEIVHDLRQLLGNDVYEMADDQTLRLNKPLVANYLFASPDHTTRINAIVHPRVKKDFLRWMSEQSTYVVLVESALLVESHLVDVVDCVLLVDAPYRLRLQRTMQRDHATETQVVARMARQLSDEEARRYADYVILNDGAADLNEQIDKVLKHILDGIQMG